MNSKIFNLFSEFCPDVLKLINYFNWEDLDKRFDEHMELNKMKMRDSNVSSLDIRTSYAYLLLECYKGNKVSISFISYLNSTVKELVSQIGNNHKKRLGINAKGMLLNLRDFNYLSFFGEVCTLKIILNSEAYELILIEAPFANGKSKDFKIKNLKTGKVIFIEVLNIHLDLNQLRSNNLIEKFLFRKVKAKVLEETKNISFPLVETLAFVPVLWCFDIAKLLPIFSFLINFEKNLVKSFNPEIFIFGFTSFVQIRDTNGFYSYKYQYITKLIKDLTK